jgi:PadR family transcriptional regulator, regulatory protein PadR
MPQKQLDFMQGTLDVLVLKILTWGPNHGYGVSVAVRERTNGAFNIEEGALYHALHRLERRGLIDSEWGQSENNRRARYYRLTRAGRAELRRETARWRAYTQALMSVLEAEPA